MSDRRRVSRVHRPLRLERSLAVIFALLGTLATALLTLHWLLVLEPTLKADAQSHSRLLAQAQAQGIEQRLAIGQPGRLRDELEAALGGLLLVKAQPQDRPFIRRITLELDYELVDAPGGSLDLSLGAAECPDCLVSPVPLYRPADRQLIGIATFYTSPKALQNLIATSRLKLLLGGGFLLCLIGAAWLGTGRLLKRLTQSEANLRGLFEVAPFPMVLREDGAPGLSRANQAAMDYLDLREEPWGYLTSPDWRALLEAGLPTVSQNHRERLINARDGRERWALVSAIPLKLSGGPSHLVSLVDVSQLKAYQKELHLASITDGLTGLYNRRYLFLKLSEEVDRAKRGASPFSIVLFDLDHFKRVNDTFGHGVGDEVLIQAASALRGAIRGSDLAGRYGGEEFLVILPDTRAAEALVMAERIRSAIKALIWPELDLHMSLSGGVCEYAGGDIDTLLEHADRRLYAAKAAGRDRVVGEDLPTPIPAEGP
ncbi:MAG: GGDEF domain-containing protein [Bdellovibrio bacteriovorus]